MGGHSAPASQAATSDLDGGRVRPSRRSRRVKARSAATPGIRPMVVPARLGRAARRSTAPENQVTDSATLAWDAAHAVAVWAVGVRPYTPAALVMSRTARGGSRRSALRAVMSARRALPKVAGAARARSRVQSAWSRVTDTEASRRTAEGRAATDGADLAVAMR